MSIKVYGASDDLIEVEGDIEEEFNPAYDVAYTFLTFSNGAVFKVGLHDDGFWRIFPVVAVGSYWIVQGTDLDDDYSDVLTIEDDIEWIVGTDRIVKA